MSASAITAAQTLVNDFAIEVATVNGSGSQSSNNVLMRAIFQMGIPVSGKNLFPSNIAGLPTWFTIRVNSQGFVGRKKETDILVCMNPETAAEDVHKLQPGGLCIYDAPSRLSGKRSDVVFFEVPFAKLAASIPNVEARLRKLLANMCYVGVLAQLLQIELNEIELAIARQFKGKAKAVDLNVQAMRAGLEYAKANLPAQTRFKLQRMKKSAGQVIIEGNAATAMGAVMAGCSVVAWYPITPSSSLVEAFIALARKYRHDPQSGKATYAVVQAEDELASLAMVLGASWAGARAMTSTSGPGVSLMNELAGFGYYAEIPAVVVDVQRVGPSTGLPTRTQQSDILSAAFASHGDTKHICLYPGNMIECYQFAQDAFDLAEQFQTPIFVLTDLDLGMNNYVTDPLPYPTAPLKRGKVLSLQHLEELQRQGKSWERYGDTEGDGIPWRTLAGTPHPLASYFTRGSGHDEKARYSEKVEDYVRNMERLKRKFDTARSHVPQPLLSGDDSAEVGLIAYGSTEMAMPEAMHQLGQRGIKTQYLRLRAFPFSKLVCDFVARKKRVYVIEQNRDAQMLSLLKLDLPAEQTTKLRSVLHFGGIPIDARSISDEVAHHEALTH